MYELPSSIFLSNNSCFFSMINKCPSIFRAKYVDFDINWDKIIVKILHHLFTFKSVYTESKSSLRSLYFRTIQFQPYLFQNLFYCSISFQAPFTFIYICDKFKHPALQNSVPPHRIRALLMVLKYWHYVASLPLCYVLFMWHAH